MSDLGFFQEEGCWDLKIENGDLKLDDGLETAIWISLFTDKRVTDEELPHLETSKRGYWGDMFPEVDQDKIGSKLWLIHREKRSQATRLAAEDHVKDALVWMTEDGVADAVEVSSEYNIDGQLILALSLRKLTEDTRFTVVWDSQEILRG